MSILVINTSMNHNGNTVSLAEQLLQGKEYELLHLNDYLIAQIGQRTSYDQFGEVFARFDAADMVVLGTPIYWHDMTGALKLFVDRLSEDVDWSRAHFAGKQLVVIAQGAMPGRVVLDHVNNVFTKLANRTGMDYVGMISSGRDIAKVQRDLRVS